MAVDSKLLVPPSGYRLSLGLDLSLHFLPALFLWYADIPPSSTGVSLTVVSHRVDFLFFEPRFSRRANPLLISALTTLAYSTWMEHTSRINGAFPYPFLNFMSYNQRVGLYFTCIPILVGLFHLANGKSAQSSVSRLTKFEKERLTLNPSTPFNDHRSSHWHSRERTPD
jgi:hypothetical protein